MRCTSEEDYCCQWVFHTINVYLRQHYKLVHSVPSNISPFSTTCALAPHKAQNTATHSRERTWLRLRHLKRNLKNGLFEPPLNSHTSQQGKCTWCVSGSRCLAKSVCVDKFRKMWLKSRGYHTATCSTLMLVTIIVSYIWSDLKCQNLYNAFEQ